MWSKRARGMTLIELIVAVVIISVGVAGVLLVFSRSAISSTDPQIRKQMAALAEGMMEEILRMPFAIASNGPSSNSCARDSFNDIRDYAGYSQTSICDISGNVIPGLAGYGIQVAVGQPANPALFAPLAAADLLEITVTVTRTGASNYQLIGWRSNYSAAQPP
ncbi:prepilin-type N-terminal cleavage/methylation domain-containing protein [Massilia sp. NR 4-1]|uniref:prepilin-type N-terminal cleavage/methylation domain-containing protein n=1 Tax=Massilia sp. NR 4-1 TaxID=1678028 RepID=UPI000ABD4807|nr:prepilin-type N-terminal cleavage/methylation domain-containing protein [Massilia sp. NR 4-1]